MKGKGVLWAVLVGMGLILLTILSAETPLDTRIRLEREGSAPFDAEVFYRSLPAWIGAEVSPVAEPAFDRLADTTLRNTTYLFLAKDFETEEAESARLLEFVERGNTLFVAAHYMAGALFDSLSVADTTELGLGAGFPDDFLDEGLLGVEDTLQLVTPGVEGSYGFPVGVNFSDVSGLDPERSEILGLTADGEYVSLARVRYGEGEVLLSSAPLAFSNAALVGEGDAEAYVSAVLSALPSQPVLWDDYRKPYQQQAQTPFRYILATPGLAGAYWLLVSMFVLYALFRGRRWQRAIPVVKPPPNAQAEFARTVGRLHFTHGDTGRLADRAVRLFLDRLRTRLRLVDPDLSERTARLASKRAGVSEEEGVALFARLRRLKKSSRPSSSDLVDLDARIDRFFRELDAASSPREDAATAAQSPAPTDR